MDLYHDIIGINQSGLEWWQMAIRAVVVFFITILLVRVGATRIFGNNSAFVIVMGIILGSILSRAITCNSPFIPTILAAFVLIFLHVLLATFALKNNKLGWLI